jgi:hypothetical protein
MLMEFYTVFLLVSGAVPKWLRERSAKPLCSGSNPLGASSMSVIYAAEIGMEMPWR